MEVIDEAKNTLKNLLKIKFKQTIISLLNLRTDPDAIDFKAIHKVLLKNPNGVSADVFDGPTGLPDMACVHFQRFHAFLYHIPSKQYRYAGKKFEKAARELQSN